MSKSKNDAETAAHREEDLARKMAKSKADDASHKKEKAAQPQKALRAKDPEKYRASMNDSMRRLRRRNFCKKNGIPVDDWAKKKSKGGSGGNQDSAAMLAAAAAASGYDTDAGSGHAANAEQTSWKELYGKWKANWKEITARRAARSAAAPYDPSAVATAMPAALTANAAAGGGSISAAMVDAPSSAAAAALPFHFVFLPLPPLPEPPSLAPAPVNNPVVDLQRFTSVLPKLRPLPRMPSLAPAPANIPAEIISLANAASAKTQLPSSATSPAAAFLSPQSADAMLPESPKNNGSFVDRLQSGGLGKSFF